MQCNHDMSYLIDRIETLRKMNARSLQDRYRTQAIMDGGPEGIYAVMAWDMGKGASMGGRDIARKIGVDLPTVNLMHSGLERLAQKIGAAPTLKPPSAAEESEQEFQQRRIDLMQHWDNLNKQELQYPQMGRWLPGYGFGMWTIKQRRDRDGTLYPVAELRDSYDIYPGHYGANQSPDDAFATRKVPLYSLKAAYPELDWIGLEKQLKDKRLGKGIIMATSRVQTGTRTSGWEGDATGIEVIEYMAACGTHVLIPELAIQLSAISNPLDSGPAFTFVKRYSFSRLINQFQHIIGLTSQMAKLNILALIAGEDSVFRETNIFGELESGTYNRGRFAVNVLSPNSRVEKPTQENIVQVWNQIDRLERQIRIGANYDVQQDGTSPNSFATGRGMRELQGSMGANIREYHLVLRHAIQDTDAKRFELAETMYANSKRKFFDMYGKQQNLQVKTVVKGDHRTRRVYGAMATFDDSEKVIIGLQLLQGGVLDTLTLQENIDGLEDLPLINQRKAAKDAQDVLYQRLAQRAEQDPKADAALVEIMKNPRDREEILLKYFTPQEPQMSPEEMMAMQQMQAGGPGAAGPESFGTVLSRLELGGGAQGGIQTTGQLQPTG